MHRCIILMMQSQRFKVRVILSNRLPHPLTFSILKCVAVLRFSIWQTFRPYPHIQYLEYIYHHDCPIIHRYTFSITVIQIRVAYERPVHFIRLFI